MNEFKLSDKEIEACLEDHSEAKYRKSDVKKFIRLLKAEMEKSIVETTNFNETDILWNNMLGTAFDDIINRIDKLAGDLK